MRLINVIGAAVTFAVISMGGAASAFDYDNRLSVTLGVAGVLPDEKANISAIGGTVDISDEYVPSVNLDFKLNDRFSIGAICCIAPHEVKAVRTSVGTVDLGEITLFPPTVTLKYHLINNDRFDGYVGAGVNYTNFFDDDLPAGGPVTRIEYDDSFGAAIQAGFEYKLNEDSFISVDVKKIWIEPEVNLQTVLGPVRADVEINPVVAFVGYGIRF
jgi:outer membrane protein